MTRKPLVILLLLVLVVGGAGIAVFMRDTQTWKEQESRLGQKVLPDLQVNDVAQVVIRHKQESLTLVNDGGAWGIKERGGYPADAAMVSELLIKARDWKIAQSEPISEAQRPRVEVAAPDAAEGASTLLEFLGKDGKPLASLFLGKKHLGKPAVQVVGLDKGQPDGRYLLLGSDPKTLLVISDPINNAETKPDKWINKEFARVDRVKTLAVETGEPATSFSMTLDREGGDWILAGIRPGEKTDVANGITATNALFQLAFVDVAPDLKPEALEKPTTITAETYDGWTYVIRTAPKKGDAAHIYFNVAVTGEATRTERKPRPDEKPEDKEKLDKEHEARFVRLEQQLAREKTMAKWVYVIEKKQLDRLLRERAYFIEKPEKPQKPAPKK